MGCRTCCAKLWEKWLLFWNSAAGPKTIFFWAPFFKWGLVLASIADLWRPADRLSIPQSIALMFTGLIWSRYSMVIIPINWYLFSVNAFVATTQMWQTGRALYYMFTHKDDDEITTNITTIMTTTMTAPNMTNPP